ncbi:3',5'-cyclic AMP phosphodiesterase CpdA [Thermosporothrix hazakensis]|jgi:hypothetical protein|uniref:3',5'-cyclic AMP phosphodiesterase CpdA n=2 Tax=Thermosporothrix TaxID=768650 RepID=A0A326U5G0_THEHA|nr:metallophosphoesterase [Thermosporothrix hazakensis]PZW29186.1 3',5'-cyclic AMP phosphodiesterase CpdA [Thermosporothrix hazakensis]BBH86113.1 hypothetical protein KTC_08640 [Thermosporothrix sp. COM3]GCE45462.1 hypothetical protein KTH_03310 [Thermosporothrix hazakensis]
MKELHLEADQGKPEKPLLHFWGLGDLHYRATDSWQPLHRPRMQQMYEDLHEIWQAEGEPAFCVSPGDIADRGAPINFELAKRDIAAHLKHIPFYPGLGNHEYFLETWESEPRKPEAFTEAWGFPIRYAWTAGDFAFLMLDQPVTESTDVIFSQEALDFLDTTLSEHAERKAIIFAHCPLHNTVLDRDPEKNLDDDSLDPYFFVSNSDEVRAVLARHQNAALYISGHTHSGWGSPQLVCTEQLGEHPVTHLNLMSPWYTGMTGPTPNPDWDHLIYVADTPDLLVTFGFYLYETRAIVRARSHNTKCRLGQWEIPLCR